MNRSAEVANTGEKMKKSTGSRGKRVVFQVTAEPGSEVFVAGSFNNWNPTQNRMSDNPGSGHCKTTILLPPGRHEYKFVINGEWRMDLNCAESMPNGQGSMNSIVSV
ncbi:MAG: glycogen-binding domain-containing protein [Magnetococcus sp. WYHC-3]